VVVLPGQYHDEETGLSYNYHRTYAPVSGRYLESDPIGLDGGLNTYLYAKANPLRFIDPDGLRYSPYEHGMDWDGNPVQPPVAYQCAKAVAAKYTPLLLNDKHKHCMVAGEIYQTCGVLIAHVASIGKEIQDVFGPGNAEWGDLEADYAGIDCAKNPECGEGLGECCKRKGYTP
jgi:RHS repeat-associated protein